MELDCLLKEQIIYVHVLHLYTYPCTYIETNTHVRAYLYTLKNIKMCKYLYTNVYKIFSSGVNNPASVDKQCTAVNWKNNI